MASIRKLPNGKYRAWVMVDGKRESKVYELKRDAQTWAEHKAVKAAQISARGFAKPPRDVTWRVLIEKYEKALDEVGKDFGRTHGVVMKRFKKMIGDEPLDCNSEAMLNRFILARRDNDGVRGVTIKQDLAALSPIFRYARLDLKYDLPERLPLDMCQALERRGYDTQPVERDRIASDEELAMLYAHWEASQSLEIPMSQITRFAMATALRQGEICRGIRIEDIDRKNRTVVVRHRKDPKRKKTNNQTVPLLPEAWQLVLPIINERHEGFVFDYNPGNVSTNFTRTCALLGIQDLHFHDLRHSAITELFRRGLDIPKISLMSGHRSWATLARYTHVSAADVHNAYQPKSVKREASLRIVK